MQATTRGERDGPTATELPIVRTDEIRAKLMAIYDEGLGHWPVPFATFFVTTRYGQTHIHPQRAG